MFLNRLLGFDASSMKMRTEVVAGATTFLTMCYILAVNPAVLSITGMDNSYCFGYRYPPTCTNGKASLCTGTKHGLKRVLRLHTVSSLALHVATVARYHAYRRIVIHTYHLL